MVRAFLLVTISRSAFLLTGIAFAIVVALGAEIATESNVQRLERSAAIIADSILRQLPRGDSVTCLQVAGHEAAWLLESAMITRSAESGRALRRCGSSEPVGTRLAIEKLRVSFSAIPEDDAMLARTAALEVTAIVATGATLSDRLRSMTYAAIVVDSIRVADTAGLHGGYGFAVATVEAGSTTGGFWSRVLEPAIVLAAAAIVAILLFAVRSQ